MIAPANPRLEDTTDLHRSIAIVSRHRMICELFAMTATSYGDFNYEVFSDLPAFYKHIESGRPKIDLLLLDVHGSPEINENQIANLVRLSNPQNVCLLVDPLSVRRNLFWLDRGVSGITHKSMTVKRIVNAIDLMFTAGCYFPYSCIEPHEVSFGNAVKKLSSDEFEILGLLAKGLSNFEIAQEIKKSESTVKSNLLNIFKKFGVKNRTSAVLLARGQGLV